MTNMELKKEDKTLAQQMHELAMKVQYNRDHPPLNAFNKYRLKFSTEKEIFNRAENGYLVASVYVKSEDAGRFLRDYLVSKGFASEYWVSRPDRVEVTISWKRPGEDNKK